MENTKENFWKVMITVAALVAAMLAVAWLCGCTSADCGSKTIVGNHYALPKISNDTSNTDIEVYESTEGAVVYTRRDSKVEIAYTNTYTNHICGIWDKVGSMVLNVIIEPLAVDVPADEETPEETKAAEAESAPATP